ncbi:MAG: hypothetical protein PHT95_08570 [Candidatus Omnitrophica bacterium]|jgi:cupin 2 domain-containing protein|nr:hypothetical protein [Candidatus Omnitrophota bacterium]MDD4013813.1 hypothetical protein [Candidatus Omnitrophota bacterium]
MRVKNIYKRLPDAGKTEIFEKLFDKKGVRIERITSFGQSTPKGEWLKEKKNEWVILLMGRAKIRFRKKRKGILLAPGDHVFIPSGCEHRVDRTSLREKTLWLAVHF